MSNHNWELCDLLRGFKPITCKWIFTTKLRPDGPIERFKARLVIKALLKRRE